MHTTLRTRARTPLSRLTGATGAVLLALALAACGDDTSESDDTASTPAATAQAASLVVEDPWIKAADSGMTAAFGILANDGTEDLVVTGARSDVSDTMELHETVQSDDGSMAMQPKEGGFPVPAGSDHELAPGGDHIMIMELDRPLEPGETVTITLVLADGSTTDVEATVKEFTGADEDYQGGDDMSDMGESSSDGM